MAKKNRIYDYDDEDDVVIDKKTKRRLERAKNRETQQRRQEEEAVEEPVEDTGSDIMSQIALLCQENRWREAVLLGRGALAEAEAEGKEEVSMPLSMALVKIEMSLRRQMASAFMSKAKEMLKKEYLLDVGE
ncbi:MAG: hypothetical protein IKR81_17965 [Victivallales bacterium]|nr:hypothetical protein [Victivallales bacterium]